MSDLVRREDVLRMLDVPSHPAMRHEYRVAIGRLREQVSAIPSATDPRAEKAVRLAEALVSVEFVDPPSQRACPSCYHGEDDGHAEDCAIDAALAAWREEERDREKAMITHSDRIKAISITQGGTIDVPVGTWLGDLNDAIAAALAEERERCARIVESRLNVNRKMAKRANELGGPGDPRPWAEIRAEECDVLLRKIRSAEG